MLLSLSHISKRFDNGTQALADVNAEFTAGEFVSLVGPSGCGKSTLLRIIAGLLTPDHGAVAWPGGKPALGFVFQDATLMPWADALTNARLPLDLKGLRRSEANTRARAALARVGLSDFAQAFPRELSGGMKMRVSIARALAGAPKLLLMDEPFAALDEPARQALNDDLLRVAREDAITVIFVTHSVFESAYLSRRVLAMSPRPGRIKADIALNPPSQRDEQYRLTPDFAAAAKKISDALMGGAP
jgi:NitT/TauT family transport system ATP-binding protein